MGLCLVSALSGLAIPAPLSSAESTSTVVEVGDRKQLFMDNALMASSRSVHLTMNPPHQIDECLVSADEPWEKAANAYIHCYCSLRKEDEKVRLWYELITFKKDTLGKDPQAAGESIAYAESVDGIHFSKPLLGLHEFGGTRQNSIVMPVARGAAVWIDPKAPPEQRYRTQTKGAKGWLWFHHSPDGIRWEQTRGLKIGDCDTQSLAFWDKPLGRYVLYTRTWVRHADRRHNYRLHRRLESDDLIAWNNEAPVLRADPSDLATYSTPTGQPPVDYYGACIFKYPDEEGVYVMLAQSFWHWFDRSPQKELGPDRMDVRLCVSRDGKRFERCGERVPFLRLGAEESWYSRMVWAIPAPIRMGDELWLYFWGSNADHMGHIAPASGGKYLAGIGRAVTRLDGFGSADADYAGGEFTTPLIRFKGNRLELNVDTSAGGSVRVEILDEHDTPIPGLSDATVEPACGNFVRMPVSWAGSSDLGALVGKPIKLRFRMRDCKLYAFQFR
jgi:hypothetical protein